MKYLLNLHMIIFRLVILITGTITSLSGECEGFNWYHNIDTSDCATGDISALRQFIINSGDSLEMDMDVDYNGEIDRLKDEINDTEDPSTKEQKQALESALNYYEKELQKVDNKKEETILRLLSDWAFYPS